MNKAEFKAIKMIAEKLNWKTVNFETIKQMVRNQQALELDTIGECDDEEETLLSIALWDKDKITSTMYVSDYTSLVAFWKGKTFCEDMGITTEDLMCMLEFYELSENYLAECYEAEDEAMYDAYCDAWEAMYC